MKTFSLVLKKLVTFSKKKRRGINNQLKIIRLKQNNQIDIDNNCQARISLNIKGEGNYIRIKNLRSGKGIINISICGDNCRIIINDNVAVSGALSILMGQEHPNFGKISNAEVQIGEKTSFESCSIIQFNCNAKVNIGKECMFAYGITLFNTDAHPVYDVESHKLINHVDELVIGDHVWVGANASILKNSKIADDNIIGWGAVVSGTFPDKHAAVAGNPARVVKKRHNVGSERFCRLHS